MQGLADLFEAFPGQREGFRGPAPMARGPSPALFAGTKGRGSPS